MARKVSFGHFVALRRKNLQLTQAELAKRIGVSKSAIAKWETDGGLPARDNLKKLSEALKVSVDDLHKVIDNAGRKETDLKVNITPEVIAMLESYGYMVIRPGEETNNS